MSVPLHSPGPTTELGPARKLSMRHGTLVIRNQYLLLSRIPSGSDRQKWEGHASKTLISLHMDPQIDRKALEDLISQPRRSTSTRHAMPPSIQRAKLPLRSHASLLFIHSFPDGKAKSKKGNKNALADKYRWTPTKVRR